MCGRYYIEDDTAREIEKVIRWVDQKLRAQRTAQEGGAVLKEEIIQGETQEQAAGIALEQNPWNEDKENVKAGDRQVEIGKAGDVYPAALAPVLGAGVGAEGDRTLDCRMLRWGLPGYTPTGNGKKGQVIFNARSETAMEKPTFREGIKNHRIVIPAAGFYEWNRKKEKYRFRRNDSPVLFMAGCFRRYEDGDRFVILTTAANASMEPVHDRMPLILEPDEIVEWIWDGERTKNLLEKQPCLLERTTDYEQMTLF